MTAALFIAAFWIAFIVAIVAAHALGLWRMK